MIRYYAYYNHGGYKDFYLGSNQDEDEARYFLPLLAIHEQSLKEQPNEILAKEVEHQRLLPKLVVLSDYTTEYNYPTDARSLMSHAGYKLLYRCFNADTYVFAIRDIPGTMDSYGRRTPFNVMFMGDSAADVRALDILSEYVRRKLTEFESFLNTVFENDMVENGLKVHLGVLTEEISRIISSNGQISTDETPNKPIRMLVIPTGMELSSCLREQKISKYNVAVCYNTEGTTIYKAEIIQPYMPTGSFHVNHTIRTNSPLQDDHKEPVKSSSSITANNINEQEEIQKLWNYICKLEKRIEELENNK